MAVTEGFIEQLSLELIAFVLYAIAFSLVCLLVWAAWAVTKKIYVRLTHAGRDQRQEELPVECYDKVGTAFYYETVCLKTARIFVRSYILAGIIFFVLSYAPLFLLMIGGTIGMIIGIFSWVRFCIYMYTFIFNDLISLCKINHLCSYLK